MPALVKALKAAPPDSKSPLIEALGGIGPEAEPAVPLLIGVLKQKDEALQCYAADALEKIGPGAKEALPALKELSKQDSGPGRRAREAIKAIDKPFPPPARKLIRD